jgi:hypothetical protein
LDQVRIRSVYPTQVFTCLTLPTASGLADPWRKPLAIRVLLPLMPSHSVWSCEATKPAKMAPASVMLNSVMLNNAEAKTRLCNRLGSMVGWRTRRSTVAAVIYATTPTTRQLNGRAEVQPHAWPNERPSAMAANSTASRPAGSNNCRAPADVAEHPPHGRQGERAQRHIQVKDPTPGLSAQRSARRALVPHSPAPYPRAAVAPMFRAIARPILPSPMHPMLIQPPSREVMGHL